ncbi:MAG: hypothetical protein RLZZ267_343 [Bacillota bacterium]|jgi:ribosome biogenesis GTPase A
MTIQWFPGHMTRARRQIQEKLKLIDLAIELLDARIPFSSRNPMIDQILNNKPRMVLLNKADMADPANTKLWVEWFASRNLEAVPLDANSGFNVNQIIPRAKVILNDQIQKQIDRGMKPRPIRALIVGIPNVGKSTLINRLAGRKVAITGDRPGVTKGQQWIKVGTEMELLDTPGILWPKFEDMDVGLRLAATGAIKEEVLNVEDIAFQTIRYMIDAYPNALMERYHIEQLPEEIEDPQAVIAVMEAIGRRRGTLQAGGIVNLEKASIAFLRDLKDGKLGRITLELPRLKHIH